jgi:hypothetical protein
VQHHRWHVAESTLLRNVTDLLGTRETAPEYDDTGNRALDSAIFMPFRRIQDFLRPRQIRGNDLAHQDYGDHRKSNSSFLTFLDPRSPSDAAEVLDPAAVSTQLSRRSQPARTSRASSSSSSSSSCDADSDQSDPSQPDETDGQADVMSEYGLDGFMSELAAPHKRRRANAPSPRDSRPAGSHVRLESRLRSRFASTTRDQAPFDTRSCPDLLDLPNTAFPDRVNLGTADAGARELPDTVQATSLNALKIMRPGSLQQVTPSDTPPEPHLNGAVVTTAPPGPSQIFSHAGSDSLGRADARVRARTVSVLDRPRPSISLDDDSKVRPTTFHEGAPETLSKTMNHARRPFDVPLFLRPGAVDMSRSSTGSRSLVSDILNSHDDSKVRPATFHEGTGAPETLSKTMNHARRPFDVPLFLRPGAVDMSRSSTGSRSLVSDILNSHRVSVSFEEHSTAKDAQIPLSRSESGAISPSSPPDPIAGYVAEHEYSVSPTAWLHEPTEEAPEADDDDAGYLSPLDSPGPSLALSLPLAGATSRPLSSVTVQPAPDEVVPTILLDQDPRMKNWTPQERRAWLDDEEQLPAPRFAATTRPKVLTMPPPLQDQVWEEQKRQKIEEQERRARQGEEDTKAEKLVREPGRLYGRSLMDELLERKEVQKNKKKCGIPSSDLEVSSLQFYAIQIGFSEGTIVRPCTTLEQSMSRHWSN